MEVKVVNKSKNMLPAYETEASAGMDLRADIEKTWILEPMQRLLIPTGLSIELPSGYEAQIRPRSGLAIKSGIGVLNSPGTVDADYRGEIKVILINWSQDPFEIHPGDRIAQMVVSSYQRVEWALRESLSPTGRGDGGFGHTGKK
ncbi:MAG: dUTP diphosphatase [Bacteroidales bacterium]